MAAAVMLARTRETYCVVDGSTHIRIPVAWRVDLDDNQLSCGIAIRPARPGKQNAEAPQNVPLLQMAPTLRVLPGQPGRELLVSLHGSFGVPFFPLRPAAAQGAPTRLIDLPD